MTNRLLRGDGVQADCVIQEGSLLLIQACTITMGIGAGYSGEVCCGGEWFIRGFGKTVVFGLYHVP